VTALAFAGWLAARSDEWREQVQVVAIAPSAAFRKALREHLSQAAVSVDAFHLVKLAGDMLTAVRQRVSRERKGRRGRAVDASWANRRLLLRAGDTLSPAARRRLNEVFHRDDPTDEIGAAWGVKEQLRRLLSSATLAQAADHRMLLRSYVQVADMPETDRLMSTVDAWWSQIEVLVVTGVTNARTESANTSISTSSAPAEASATPSTTAPVSSWPAPPGRQREHSPQRPDITSKCEEPRLTLLCLSNHRGCLVDLDRGLDSSVEASGQCGV